MNYLRKNRSLALIGIVVAGSLLLSSCSLFSKKEEELSSEGKDIKDVVEDYLDELTDGTFADNDFTSEYASDSPFDELDVSSDVIDIISSTMKDSSYEFTTADGDEDDGDGSCDVVITAVDARSIIEDIDEDDLDADTLSDAITDKDADTKDYEITLDLTYDEDEEEWIISDSSAIYEIFGEPYADLSLAGDTQGAVDAVNQFISALSDGDADTIESITDYYSDDFFPYDEGELAVTCALYDNMTVSLDDAEADDDSVTIPVTITIPDLYSATYDAMSDTSVVAPIIKDYLLNSYLGLDTTSDESEMYLQSCDLVAELLQDSSVETTDISGEFVLEADSDGNWIITEVPDDLLSVSSELSSYYPLDYVSDYEGSCIAAIDLLLAAGSIDQTQYDEMYTSLSAYLSDDVTADSASVIADINLDNSGWYDSGFVTEYPAGTTSINYYLEMYSSEWGSVPVTVSFYAPNETESSYSYDDSLLGGYIDAYYSNDDYSELATGTYRVVMTLEDGTAIVDQSVNVG